MSSIVPSRSPSLLSRIAAASLMVLSMAACRYAPTSGGTDAPLDGQWLKRTVEVDGRRYPVQIFVPARADVPAPLVLFLHGSGERGEDGERQTQAGLGPYLRAHSQTFPAYAVLPQAPDDSDWSGASARAALAAVDLVQREFAIDPDRISLTGLSRGGYGVWDVASLAPTRFAALAPICAGVRAPATIEDLRVVAVAAEADPYRALALTLHHLPIWIFHGALDDLILPDDSRRMKVELEALGASVRYTEFPDADHNAWDPAYNHPPFWTWLFAQRREPTPPRTD